MKSVLFVCHGNICRSPMAEFIFKKMVRDAGFAVAGSREGAATGEKSRVQEEAEGMAGAESVTGTGEEGNNVREVFRVESAAVSYEEIGNDIYPPAKRTLTAHGVPFSRHSAHRITDAEANEYDVIVTMDSSNRRLISRIISPANMAKVHSMMEYAGKDSDVSDPWYTGDFETTYRDIVEGCAGLLKTLVKAV